MNLLPYLKGLALMLGLSALWATPSPEALVAETVQPDDPMQIDDQISASQLLSCRNLFVDLAAIGITPVGSHSTSRLKNPGSSILPYLSPTLFTTTGIASLQHPDEAAVAPTTV